MATPEFLPVHFVGILRLGSIFVISTTMKRFRPILIPALAALVVAVVALSASTAWAAAADDTKYDARYLLDGGWRGAGYYLSWIKMAACWLVFLAWVGSANWVNRDCQDSQPQLGPLEFDLLRHLRRRRAAALANPLVLGRMDPAVGRLYRPNGRVCHAIATASWGLTKRSSLAITCATGWLPTCNAWA